MTLDEARALREAAGQPTEWPAGIAPPLSRLALTRIVATQCQEKRLKTSQWDISLYDPLVNDSGNGDAALAIVIDRVGELLQISIVSPHASFTLGDLIEFVEEAFLEHWRLSAAISITDEQLFDMLGRAVGKPLTGDEAIAELVPEAQLAGFWQKLPEPWGNLWPAVGMKTIWWPLSERTWAGVGIWAVLAYLLWKNIDVSIGSRVILSAIVVWLCWTFVVEQPVRPVWPKELVTVRDVAHAMLGELREQLAHWEMLERDWGVNRFLEAQIG
jgi:hypothetical protein